MNINLETETFDRQALQLMIAREQILNGESVTAALDSAPDIDPQLIRALAALLMGADE